MEQPYHDEQESTNSFDIKRFFSKLLHNYPWFLLLTIVFTAAAFFYIRYTIPLYQVAAYIQVQPSKDAASILGGSPFSSSGNRSTAVYPDMNGEIFKLQSAALVGEVVDSLKLNIEVSMKGKVRNMPVDMDDLPFRITVKRVMPDQQSPLYKLTLYDQYYTLYTAAGTGKGIYNQPLIMGGDTVILALNNKPGMKNNNNWWCRFQGRQQTITNYTGRLLVGPVSKGGAGMIQVVMRDEISQRAKKIVEVLLYKYDVANFLFKNKALRSEIDFLDSRLGTVNAELEAQENYVRNFKASNKINDVSSSANQLLSNLTNIDSKKSDNEYKENLLKIIENNMNASSNKEERVNVPGLEDVDLVNLVGKYNELVAQKKDILEKAAPLDLRLPPLNAKLDDTKKNILKRVISIRQELSANNDFLAGQERTTTSRFVTLPEKEKDYIQVNRLLNIKQSLYVFLLQKKEDKNIEFASSNIQGSRVVDWRVSNIQEPKPSILYLGSLLAALLLPSLILLGRFLLNRRIESPQDIYRATAIPIAGEIAFVGKRKEEIVTRADNVSPIAEQFRTLRTNIFYLGKDLVNKVLLVTSGISGEGKSFISLNLANTLAISNKKTVLLEFDLRNPGLSQHLQLTGIAGITNYLAGETGIPEIIQPVQNCPNLFFINGGLSQTGNPGEIILNNRMPLLFDYLREQFDFVVIDSPPIEAVSDALTLSKWADACFFVVRHKYSFRSSLLRLNRLNEDEKVPHPAIIVNGIKPGGGFDNVNGYGYGYGYDNKAGRKKKKRNTKLKIA